MVAMTRIIVALALAVACSTSALAAPGKTNSGRSYGNTTANGIFVPHSKKLRDALGGWNQGDPNDPYWDPCLSYDRGWGPGACGGR